MFSIHLISQQLYHMMSLKIIHLKLRALLPWSGQLVCYIDSTFLSFFLLWPTIRYICRLVVGCTTFIRRWWLASGHLPGGSFSMWDWREIPWETLPYCWCILVRERRTKSPTYPYSGKGNFMCFPHQCKRVGIRINIFSTKIGTFQKIMSISKLSIPWLHVWPGHHQPRYWLYRI